MSKIMNRGRGWHFGIKTALTLIAFIATFFGGYRLGIQHERDWKFNKLFSLIDSTITIDGWGSGGRGGMSIVTTEGHVNISVPDFANSDDNRFGCDIDPIVANFDSSNPFE